MEHIIIQYYQTPVGELILGDYDGRLCLCDWRYRKMRTSIDQRIHKALNAGFTDGESPIIAQTIAQLKEYFEGDRKTFTIPLQFVGTTFQRSVWNALKQVPYGQTESYLGLSRILGNELAIRAVATANGANALAIIIPCHRIIGADGALVGYAGGLPAKKKLLQLENAMPASDQLRLF